MSRWPSRRLTTRAAGKSLRLGPISLARSRKNNASSATKSKRSCRWSSSKWNSLRSYRTRKLSRSRRTRIWKRPSNRGARLAKTWWAARGTVVRALRANLWMLASAKATEAQWTVSKTAKARCEHGRESSGGEGWAGIGLTSPPTAKSTERSDSTYRDLSAINLKDRVSRQAYPL